MRQGKKIKNLKTVEITEKAHHSLLFVIVEELINAMHGPTILALPALLNSLANPLGVLPPVLLVKITGLNVGRACSVRIIKQTLYARQDCSNVVGGTPAVLQDIQAQLPGGVDVRVKHLRDELDAGRLVGILLLKVHHQAEGSVLERSIGRSDDDGVPSHNIVANRGRADTGGRIGLHALEVTHQATASGSRHNECSS